MPCSCRHTTCRVFESIKHISRILDSLKSFVSNPACFDHSNAFALVPSRCAFVNAFAPFAGLLFASWDGASSDKLAYQLTVSVLYYDVGVMARPCACSLSSGVANHQLGECRRSTSHVYSCVCVFFCIREFRGSHRLISSSLTCSSRKMAS